MNVFKKVGCRLIGWNPDILKECGEASNRQFRKLMSAISIMMILWGTIGYCFAERYIVVESLVAKILIAMTFMFIVMCVERVIILNVGKAPLMSIVRVCMAVCMAILGSCIFDQIIFSNDIVEHIKERREDRIIATIKKQLSIFEEESKEWQSTKDSISDKVSVLEEKFAQKPTITVTNTTTITKVAGFDEHGNEIKVNETSASKNTLPNPIGDQIASLRKEMAIYDKRLDDLHMKKMSADSIVRGEFNSRDPGFIEELEGTYAVISNSWVSCVFYIILFLFMLLLELFVLTIKLGENKCDYDLIVEQQLSIKSQMIQDGRKY